MKLDKLLEVADNLFESAASGLPKELRQLFTEFGALREILNEMGVDYDTAQSRYQALLKNFSFPMTVWRALDLSAGELDKSSLGTHWTWDKKSAKAYSTKDKKIDDPSHHIINTKVTSDQIDWESTIAYNLLSPSEREITLKKGSKIKIDNQSATI